MATPGLQRMMVNDFGYPIMLTPLFDSELVLGKEPLIKRQPIYFVFPQSSIYKQNKKGSFTH